MLIQIIRLQNFLCTLFIILLKFNFNTKYIYIYIFDYLDYYLYHNLF